MITGMSVRGYKALKDLNVPLAKLNLIVGENGVGKSSLLQVLLLLRQSVLSGEGERMKLELSGDLFEAGTAHDILHPEANYSIDIELNEVGQTFKVGLRAPRNDNAASPRYLNASQLLELPDQLSGRNFSYLNAERIGPRLWSKVARSEGLAGVLGKYGEFTADYFARSFQQGFRVPGWSEQLLRQEALELLELDASSLAEVGSSQFRLANLLLDAIVPGVHATSRELADMDAASIRFIRDLKETKSETRPTHVGFGYSVTLPVVLGALVSHGGWFLVENPEAHLHPKSQSFIGRFLGLAANLCDQIFVETHSDHVLNGVRLAVKAGVLAASDVRILYFHRAADGAKVTPLSMDQHGSVSDWPHGFFDQIEEDLARL